MQRRILTSALALLAATTAAKAAEASTNVTVTSTTPGHITDTSGDDWTEDTKWGDIGAYYSTGYDIYSNYDGSSKYEQVTGSLGGVLFNDDITVADVSLKVHAGKTSTLKGDYDLSVFGVQLIDIDNLNLSNTGKAGVSITLAEFESSGVTYSANGNWGSDGVDLSVDVTATVDADMTFVGIPLVFSAGASGAVGINAGASASYNSTSKVSSINFTGEPYAELDLVASAGVGTGVASVGVSGSLTLLHVGLPITNTLSLTPTDATTGAMQYSTAGYLTLSSLGGEIDLYLHVWPFTYSYTIFDWDGIDWANVLLFTDSVPIAASPKVSVYGPNATLSYVYADPNPESGSTIKWYRANNSSGSGSGLIQNNGSKTYALADADTMRFLRACVTPSNGVNSGSQVCSDWQSVGPLLTYYKDSSYGGDSLTVAYTKSRSGYCFEHISDLGSNWNDKASSYQIQGVPGCTTILHMWKDASCSGSEATRTLTLGESVSSMSSTLGSSWNDELTSFSIVYCDQVDATDVSVVFDGYKAEGSYTLKSKSLFDTDESAFEWYTATDANGTGSTLFSTSSSFSLSPTYAGQFLKFCVTPDNGTTTGNKACSDWTHVPAVVFYWDSNYGGSSLTFPYTQSASGACFNIGDVKSGWNDDVSSLKLIAPKTHSARVYVYKDANCSGSEANTYAASGSTTSVSSLGGTYGSGWNDELSSFKVVY